MKKRSTLTINISSSYPEPYYGLPAQILQQEKEVTMQGWMKKKSGRDKLNFSASNYEKRFFVLLKGWFYYYKDVNSEKPQKHFSLQGYCNRISLADEERCPSLPYVFKVFPKCKGGRTWYFATDSEVAMNQWREAFRNEIDKYSDKGDQLHLCSLPINYRSNNEQVISPPMSERDLRGLSLNSTNSNGTGSVTSSVPEECDFCNESAYEQYDFQPESIPEAGRRRSKSHYVTPTSTQTRLMLPLSPPQNNFNPVRFPSAANFPFHQSNVSNVPIVTNGPPVPDRGSPVGQVTPIYQTIDPEPNTETIFVIGQSSTGFVHQLSPSSNTSNSLTKVEYLPLHSPPSLPASKKPNDQYEVMNFSGFHLPTSSPNSFLQPVQNNNKNITWPTTKPIRSPNTSKTVSADYSKVCEDSPTGYKDMIRNEFEDYDDTINTHNALKQLLNGRDQLKESNVNITGSTLPNESETNKHCPTPKVLKQFSVSSLPKVAPKTISKSPSPSQDSKLPQNKLFAQVQDLNNNKCKAYGTILKKRSSKTETKEQSSKTAAKPATFSPPSGQDSCDYKPKMNSKPNNQLRGTAPPKTELKVLTEISTSFAIAKEVKKNEKNIFKKSASTPTAANNKFDKVKHFRGDTPKKKDSTTPPSNNVLHRAKIFDGNSSKPAESSNNVQDKAKMFSGNTAKNQSNPASKTAKSNFSGGDSPVMFGKPGTTTKPAIPNKPCAGHGVVHKKTQ